MKELLSQTGIDMSLMNALEKQEIEVPTEVQKKVLPAFLDNRDLVIQSETGSGKTLAYLLPLYKKIDPSKREMQALILVPTHELAIQVLRQIEKLSEFSEIKATSTSIVGNVNIKRQVDKLKDKPHIIVGTPGRVMELISKKKISAHTLSTIIIDEADRLIDHNNFSVIQDIVKRTLRERQLLMFSASISKEAQEKAKTLMKDPLFLSPEKGLQIPEGIVHYYIVTELRDKVEMLRKAIRSVNPNKAIVFIGDREDAEVCASKLAHHKIKAESIHGQNVKLDRKKIMEDFKSGKTEVLVASDLAARGLDIEDVTHIFNFHIPQSSKDYLHRSGRTGRKNKVGTVISIVTEHEIEFIKRYEKDLGITIAGKVLKKGSLMDLSKKY